MTDTRTSVKALLVALAASQQQTADLLRAVAETLPEGGGEGDDPLLGTKQIFAETGLGHDGVKAAAERGELAVSRGPRGKLLVLRSELRRYLQSKPLKTRRAMPAATLDAWDVEAERSLRQSKGRH